MIHSQLDERRRVKGAASFACAALFGYLIGGSSGPASAGEFDRSTVPAAVGRQARCDSRNERLRVLKDSGDCRRISGYIAAGGQFGTDNRIGGLPSPFGELAAPEFVDRVRAAGAALIAAPAEGFSRIFLPSSSADEAR